MKTEQTMKLVGAAACLCLALGLTARAEEGSSTNAPAQHRAGPGLHRGAGGGEAGGMFAGNREEMQKFRESLKDMTPEQRQAAMQQFRQKMAEKLKERIEQSDKLTAEQKKEILAHMEKMKAEREKIMSDSSLNEEQKREAMKKLSEKTRELFQKHREALEGQHAPKAGDKPNVDPKQATEAKPSV